MPWGKYGPKDKGGEGRLMADVPDDYFLHLWNEKKCSGYVKFYIQQNLDAIKANCDRKRGIVR
jgi:uncharacterized protein (DUF3820 family)